MRISEEPSQVIDQFQSTRRLPFLPDFSRRDRESLGRAADELDERQRQTNAAMRRQAVKLRDDLQRRVHRILGDGGMAQLRDSAQRELRAFHDVRQPPGGLGLDDRKLRKAARRRIDALLRRLGTTPATLKSLAVEYDARLMEVLADTDDGAVPAYHLESHLDEWLKLSPLHEHPLPWGIKPPDDPDDPYRTFLFRPPFWGFLFGLWHESDGGFAVDRELYLDPHGGLVGNIVRLDCNDPGWGAAATAKAYAQIAFGLVPPAAGILRVIVDVQSLPYARYDLSIRDNFGWSHASARQLNWITMTLFKPDGAAMHLARVDESTAQSNGEDVTIDHSRLYPSQHYFATFFSWEPVRAGESVIVTVGTRSLDLGSAGHMDFHSRSDYRWFISSVEVRVEP